MHHSEWLDQAKKVPVGQKRRVDHGCGATKSLDVWNNSESWSAYCHRCKTSGKIYKEALEIPDDVVVYRKYCNESDLIELHDLASKHPYLYARMIVLLQEKGVSTAILGATGATVKYNMVDHRLVLRFPDVDLGRDCTGTSSAKWLKYYKDIPKSFVYLQGKNEFTKREPIVVCEDTFSAAKVWYYTGYSAMSLLGTNVDPSKLNFLLDKEVLICTDGDKAGYDCASLLKQRCDLMGTPYKVLNVPDGYDPKDLSPNQLSELLKCKK